MGERCQSCGMPLSAEFANLGTEADGSFSEIYCTICYEDGEFTMPDLTLEDMIQLSIDHMTNELAIEHDAAERLARGTIPGLLRWRS